MEIEKLINERKVYQDEVNALQAELNKAKSIIFAKKNDEKFTTIANLKLHIKDFKDQLANREGINKKLTELKQQLGSKESYLNSLQKKIAETENELVNSTELLHLKTQEIEKTQKKNEQIRNEAEKQILAMNSLENQDVLKKNEKLKKEIFDLEAEFSELSTNKADPLFLLSKAEQQIKKLKQEFKELMDYYDGDLILQIEEVLPKKIEEKELLLAEMEEKKMQKEEFTVKIDQFTSQIANIEKLVQDKKFAQQEKQETIRAYEKEIEELNAENETMSKLLEEIRSSKSFFPPTPEEIEILQEEIQNIQHELSTKESNYKNGIRSINNRLQQTTEYNQELKRDIKNFLLLISKKRNAAD